jgi:hypothetical protein
VARGYFAANIIVKKILDARIGGQVYSRILMIFAKVVTIVKKLEDSKQKVWSSW